jgi:hypothetical protein
VGTITELLTLVTPLLRPALPREGLGGFGGFGGLTWLFPRNVPMPTPWLWA